MYVLILYCRTLLHPTLSGASSRRKPFGMLAFKHITVLNKNFSLCFHQAVNVVALKNFGRELVFSADLCYYNIW